MTQEALKLALVALEEAWIFAVSTFQPTEKAIDLYDEARAAIKEALAQTQEPVAWLLTDKNINSIQVDSIQRLINRLNHAHHTDLCVRINGQDEWFQADWLKHMVRATPPQRTWVGLTDEDKLRLWLKTEAEDVDRYAFAKAVEAALKELNT